MFMCNIKLGTPRLINSCDYNRILFAIPHNLICKRYQSQVHVHVCTEELRDCKLATDKRTRD